MQLKTGNSGPKSISNSSKGFLYKFKNNRIFMAVAIALLIFVIGGIVNRSFIAPSNIGSILSMAVLLGFAAAGQTLVIIVGGEGIDLSVGAVMSLGAVIAAETIKGHNSMIVPALIFVVAAGAVVGAINGAGVLIARIPPLVMTLAMANVVTTVQLIYTRGTPTGSPGSILAFIGTKRLLPILPWLVILGVLMVVLMHLVFQRTTYGKQLYATGSNLNASYLSGVKVNLVKGLAYTASGILSAVAGYWLIAYNNFVYVNMGAAYVLPSVAAVVIGGTSLAGGEGSYTGTMIGAIVLTTLGSLLVLLHTDEAGRQIINGVVLIILLAAYTRQPSIRQ
jgi:ribose transport system permease protein